jgi:hypothetical protein
MSDEKRKEKPVPTYEDRLKAVERQQWSLLKFLIDAHTDKAVDFMKQHPQRLRKLLQEIR